MTTGRSRQDPFIQATSLARQLVQLPLVQPTPFPRRRRLLQLVRNDHRRRERPAAQEWRASGPVPRLCRCREERRRDGGRERHLRRSPRSGQVRGGAGPGVRRGFSRGMGEGRGVLRRPFGKGRRRRRRRALRRNGLHRCIGGRGRRKRPEGLRIRRSRCRHCWCFFILSSRLLRRVPTRPGPSRLVVRPPVRIRIRSRIPRRHGPRTRPLAARCRRRVRPERRRRSAGPSPGRRVRRGVVQAVPGVRVGDRGEVIDVG